MRAARDTRRAAGAAGRFAPAADETVLWSLRRSPPAIVVAAALAAPLAAVGLGDGRAVVAAALLLAAALVLAAGVRAQRVGWVQRYWVTDRRVVVEERGGTIRWLALDGVAAVEMLGQRVAFSTASGEELQFRVVRAPGRLARRLSTAMPGIPVVRVWDPTGYS